eukprot:8751892-Pyramimonas_sp.AAC.1
MEGGSCSRCGSRLRPAYIRHENIVERHRWKAGRFQNVHLALAPRTFVSQNARASRMEGGSLFKMWF